MSDICRIERQMIDLTADEVVIEPTLSVREGAIAGLNAPTIPIPLASRRLAAPSQKLLPGKQASVGIRRRS